ncbi:hypothetical protein U9M48_040620 [Paspalum notatum var. saurae]|uniref:Uncharacterized protein n=1 Tax=Paspalum notatum var. saurae TaxID=547442 RepID=A0AAQ3XCK5_PASNO
MVKSPAGHSATATATTSAAGRPVAIHPFLSLQTWAHPPVFTSAGNASFSLAGRLSPSQPPLGFFLGGSRPPSTPVFNQFSLPVT